MRIRKSSTWRCAPLAASVTRLGSREESWRWEVLNPLLQLAEDAGMLLEAIDEYDFLCGAVAAISWKNVCARDRTFEHEMLSGIVKEIGLLHHMEDDTVLVPFLYFKQGHQDVFDAFLTRVAGRKGRRPVVIMLWDGRLHADVKDKGFLVEGAGGSALLKGIACLERNPEETRPPRACLTGRACRWKDAAGCTFEKGTTLPCLRLPENGRFSHSDLVALAMRWLDAKGFRVVVSEPGYRREQPDAVGFKGGGFSCLVECKASRGDFLRDRDKPFRKAPAMGIGTMRVYLVAPGVCTVDDLPDGWQLLEALDLDTLVLKRGARGCLEMSKEFIFREKLWQAEWDLLYSWAYRKINGCLKPVPRTGRVLKIIQEDV